MVCVRRASRVGSATSDSVASRGQTRRAYGAYGYTWCISRIVSLLSSESKLLLYDGFSSLNVQLEGDIEIEEKSTSCL